MSEITVKDTEITTFKKSQLNFITEIKQKIRQAQYEAMQTVNMHLINWYEKLVGLNILLRNHY